MCRLSRNPGALTSRNLQGHVGLFRGYFTFYSAPLYICLLKVLCPVSRPKTLVCVLLKDNNRALVARSGPEINSQACLCVLQGPHHNIRQWRTEGVVWVFQTPPEIPNYSCLQNPWLGGHCPQIPVLSVLCPQLNLLNSPRTKFLGTPLISDAFFPSSVLSFLLYSA
jgi:hypothetical protein